MQNKESRLRNAYEICLSGNLTPVVSIFLQKYNFLFMAEKKSITYIYHVSLYSPVARCLGLVYNFATVNSGTMDADI